MFTLISVYLELIEEKEKDENAYFNVILPEEKGEIAIKIIEDFIYSNRNRSSLIDIALRAYLVEKLTEEGIQCRLLPQQIRATDDNIWSLSLVTNDYYFYMRTENMTDLEGVMMFRTHINEQLVCEDYFACTELWDNLIDIVANKTEVLYIASDIEDLLEDIK